MSPKTDLLVAALSWLLILGLVAATLGQLLR